MPKMNQKILTCAVYLYASRSEADNGSNFGGTGFLVSIPSVKYPDKAKHGYVVSNWHTAIKGAKSVVRLNRRDGKTEIFEYGPEDWEKDPNGYDIAAVSIKITDDHDAGFVPLDLFADEKTLAQYEVGVADNVFMVGRFVDHDGGPTNMPAARFGHISVMPSPMKMDTGVVGKNFCIDIHSRTGYSGSPVFVYRLVTDDMENTAGFKVRHNTGIFKLLGIHYAQFPEELELKNTEPKQYLKGMSGMTCIIPAWNIAAMLNSPKFVKRRQMAEDGLDQYFRTHGEPSSSESADLPAKTGDEILRAMLQTPPTPVTKSKAKAKKGDG